MQQVSTEKQKQQDRSSEGTADVEKGSRYQESSSSSLFAQILGVGILCFQDAEELTEAGPGICEAPYSPAPWRCVLALTESD